MITFTTLEWVGIVYFTDGLLLGLILGWVFHN